MNSSEQPRSNAERILTGAGVVLLTLAIGLGSALHQQYRTNNQLQAQLKDAEQMLASARDALAQQADRNRKLEAKLEEANRTLSDATGKLKAIAQAETDRQKRVQAEAAERDRVARAEAARKWWEAEANRLAEQRRQEAARLQAQADQEIKRLSAATDRLLALAALATAEAAYERAWSPGYAVMYPSYTWHFIPVVFAGPAAYRFNYSSSYRFHQPFRFLPPSPYSPASSVRFATGRSLTFQSF